VLKSVEALEETDDLGTLACRVGRGRILHHCLDLVEQFEAERVVDPLEFPLGLLDPAAKLRMLYEPTVSEPGLSVQLGDMLLGAGDPAVELPDDRRGVRRPRLFSAVLGPSR
jgi:hypothetical protein